MELIRISNEPVFRPEGDEVAVFNPGAALNNDDEIKMWFRTTKIGPHDKYGRYVSILKSATTQNFIDWHRCNEPPIEGNGGNEERGIEDPRIVLIDKTHFMTYVGFGGRYDEDFRICYASSKDLVYWDRHGGLLPEANKNAAFFPEIIGGEYILLHRRRHRGICLSFSKDLKSFCGDIKILGTIPNSWQSVRIGIAGPPVRHPKGWLLFYHGVDPFGVYRLGVALLDYEKPWIVKARQKGWVLQPELPWEMNGFVSNVIFSCATLDVGDRYVIIYAGADTVIGVAYIEKKT